MVVLTLSASWGGRIFNSERLLIHLDDLKFRVFSACLKSHLDFIANYISGLFIVQRGGRLPQCGIKIITKTKLSVGGSININGCLFSLEQLKIPRKKVFSCWENIAARVLPNRLPLFDSLKCSSLGSSPDGHPKEFFIDISLRGMSTKAHPRK